VPFVLDHGWIIGRLVNENAGAARRDGQRIGANYPAQGLKPSKHFWTWHGLATAQ
jgi:dCTP deaminase